MLLIKRLKAAFNSLDQRKPRTRVIAFCISIISTSAAISVAVFTKDNFFLVLDSLLAAITLTLSIVPGFTKMAFLSGLLSLVASVVTILYGLTAHYDLLKPYLSPKFGHY